MSSKNNTGTSTLGAVVGSDHQIFIGSSDVIIGWF
jgi:hypothetical protein